jgi:hypothetical protein
LMFANELHIQHSRFSFRILNLMYSPAATRSALPVRNATGS